MSSDDFDSLNSSESDKHVPEFVRIRRRKFQQRTSAITTGGWTFFYLGLFYYTATTRAGR